MSKRPPRHTILVASLLAFGLSGCAVGPAYKVPSTPQPAAFKEAGPWMPAAPADMLERGPWWTLFRDPLLSDLVSKVEVSNQNVAAAVAQYAQARALVAQQRAALFPAVSLGASANNTGGPGLPSSAKLYQVNIGASWEPDIWGRLRAAANSAGASAQASAADLANARLSAQGELAINYFALRQTDAQREILAQSIEAYQRVLKITQNRFDAGIAAKSDVLQAKTQLANTQVDDLNLARARAQLEHAIALLLGKAPAEFTLAPAPWQTNVPVVPPGVPASLLQRRPDIAAAERRVAAANEQIGVARAAYFPNISLTGSYGNGAASLGDLFSVSHAVWSLGLSAAQTVFNAGATRAVVEGAEAQQQVATAQYRQTVLAAFGDVENQLSATHVLAQQQEYLREASDSANQVEQQFLNRYKAGQVSYTDVVVVQAVALNARRALVQSLADQQATAVALIQSLGGGWHTIQ